MQVTDRQGMLFCLVGPSAGGKSSLAKYILEQYPDRIKLSISATTRSPRSYEKDQIDYYFISREQFEADRAAGKFFESAEVHGNYYGTYLHTVEECIKSGVDLLLDIDIQGVESFKARYPEATVVTFIVPPSIAALKNRITKRSQISPEELNRRLDTAKKECSGLLELANQGLVDYFIVNDDKAYSESQVSAIYAAEALRVSRLRQQFIRQYSLF